MKTKRIAVDGVELAATDRGDGPLALVFLHYWGGSERTWTEVTAPIAETHRVIAYDHRGWGDSGASPDGYAIGRLADDAARVIAELAPSRYVLVGHSMGGKVAQLLASRRPAGLVGLVLVAPSPAGGVCLPDAQREQMLHAYDDAASAAATLDGVLTAHPLSAALRQRAIEDIVRGDPAAKAAWPQSSIAEDVSADLRRIEVPTLVIAGEHDRVDPPSMLEHEVVARISGATMRVLPGSGHLSPLEAPAGVADAIATFVRERVA